MELRDWKGNFILLRQNKGWLINFIFLLLMSLSSVKADFYGGPFYLYDRYTGRHEGESIDLAINLWWEAYKKYWGVKPYGGLICSYNRTDYIDGLETGIFVHVVLNGSCGGGGNIYGTLYSISEKVLGTPNPETCDGNPCDASTGNKFQTEVDYNSATLSFTRYYNSLVGTQSTLGPQWRHGFLASLTIADTVKANRPDGKVLEFHNNAGNWKSDADIAETLVQVGSLWKFKTNNDAIETYSSTGQLLSLKSRDGKLTQFAYSSDNRLEQITGPFGRTLSFSYDTSGRLITLTAPENTQIHYGYDSTTGNLISVTYPDYTTNDLSDNPKRIYLYENPSFPHHLTGILDEKNHRFATWAYNDQGLVILSEHNSSAEKVELDYLGDGTTVVADALGRIKTYTFETHYGIRKPKTIQLRYHDGAQERIQTKHFSYYPENGWLKELTDYNGYITYYEYNDRGLVTLETQAKGTPESRTIITIWHPELRLPTRIVELGKIIDFSYDAQGRLLNRTETSTADTVN